MSLSLKEVKIEKSSNLLFTRMPLNLITNFVSIFVTTIIGLWLTPYLIKNLGVAVYGILPLFLSLLKYFNLLSSALTTAVARFLTLSIHKKEYKAANKYYCSAIFGVIFLAIGLVSVTLIVLPWLQNIVIIPKGYITQAKGLLALVVLSTILHMLSAILNIGFFANHRFDLQNIIKIIADLTRLLCIGLGLAYISKSLYVVGMGYVLLSLILVIGGYLYIKKLEPNLVFSKSAYSPTALRQMSKMGGWALLNSVGILLYYNIDFVIINRVLGPTAGGMYAPIVQLTLLITLVTSSLNQMFAPIVIQSIAEGNNEKIKQQTYNAIRYLGFFIILPIITICGFSKSLLTLWLGDEFTDLYKLIWLLMIPLIVINPVRPLFALLNGLNAVKYLGIITLFGGVLNLCLSLMLVTYTDLGLYAVGLATIISLLIRNLLFLPFYSMKLIKGEAKKIYVQLLLLIAISVISIFILNRVDMIIPPKNIAMLIVYGGAFSAVYFLLLFMFIINKDEKNMVVRFFKRIRGTF